MYVDNTDIEIKNAIKARNNNEFIYNFYRTYDDSHLEYFCESC